MDAAILNNEIVWCIKCKLKVEESLVDAKDSELASHCFTCSIFGVAEHFDGTVYNTCSKWAKYIEAIAKEDVWKSTIASRET